MSNAIDKQNTPVSGSDAPTCSRLSLQVRLERDDSMPAFGAFLRCEAQHDQSPVIYLNVEACMSIDAESTEEIKRNIITTLMHEFGHVLESYFRLPDNEDAIDKAIDDWQQILTASAHAYADKRIDDGARKSMEALDPIVVANLPCVEASANAIAQSGSALAVNSNAENASVEQPPDSGTPPTRTTL
jgi:hypothetical protein